jgi:hypothetical protein
MLVAAGTDLEPLIGSQQDLTIDIIELLTEGHWCETDRANEIGSLPVS